MMRLLLHWDPEIDGEFRRAFERALDNLAIAHDSLDGVDEPRESAVNVALASPAAAPRERPKDAILIIAGPGETNTASNALRLETRDIDDTSRRWLGVLEKLAAALDRRALTAYVAAGDDPDARKAWALAHASDPLAVTVEADFDPADLRARLAAETQRADAAMAQAKLLEGRLAVTLRETSRSEGEAVGLKREAEISAAGLRSDLESAYARIGELEAMLEATAYPPHRIPEDKREAAIAGRREASLARVMADRAEAIAQEAPDQLRWPGAHYVGETRNRLPHGLGVMTYVDKGRQVGAYRGAFEAGQRCGLGVGESDGLTWSGRWRDDEACGLGVLDAADGRRFEGEVEMQTGAPRRRIGHTWATMPATLFREASPPGRKLLSGG